MNGSRSGEHKVTSASSAGRIHAVASQQTSTAQPRRDSTGKITDLQFCLELLRTWFVADLICLSNERLWSTQMELLQRNRYLAR
jgi:hypothetical protein